MKKLVFFLEEQSCQAFLTSLLPRILDKMIILEFHSFQGKNDLDKSIMKRLRGYQIAPHEQVAFVIIRDQDFADCKELKKTLLQKTEEARTQNILIRIACRELESFYLGDLEIIAKLYASPQIERKRLKKKYKTPDALAAPSKELKNLTNGQYQKISGSRQVGLYMNTEIHHNSSVSFRSLITGVHRLIERSFTE